MNKSLTFVKFTNLNIRIMLDFNCTHYFFVDHSIFIIYNKVVKNRQGSTLAREGIVEKAT